MGKEEGADNNDARDTASGGATDLGSLIEVTPCGKIPTMEYMEPEPEKSKNNSDDCMETDQEDKCLRIPDTPENRFKEFVVQGCRIFVRTSQLLVALALHEEAVPIKDSALQKVAGSILSATLGEFVPFAGTVTKAVLKSSDFLRKKVKQKRGHDAARSVHKVIAEVKPENWLKVMVPVFADIFLSYNVQCVEVLHEDNLKKSDNWMISMYKLASDTVFRIFHGLREASRKNEDQSKIQPSFVKKDLIKAFLDGRSDGGWMKKQKIKIFGGALGHKLLKDKNGTSVTTQMVFEYPKVKNDSFVHGSSKMTTPSFPYRHAFEGEDIAGEKYDCHEPQMWEDKEVKDMYNDLTNKRDALLKDVINELEKQGYYTFTSHDWAAKISELQTAITQAQGFNAFFNMWINELTKCVH